MTDVMYSLDYVTIKKIILFNSRKINKAQLEFTLKVMERANWSPVIDVLVNKNCLLVFVFIFFLDFNGSVW